MNLSRFLKGVKPLVLYDMDRGVVMVPMQGKLASSQFDFGYTEQFCIPGVTSVFLSSCDSVVGDSLWLWPLGAPSGWFLQSFSSTSLLSRTMRFSNWSCNFSLVPALESITFPRM